MQQKLIQEFQQRFNAKPKYLVQAPGRVNIIGEHTDYNDGFVLPMAINRYIWLAFSPRTDQQVNIYTMNFEEQQSFNLDDLQHGNNSWIEYVKGVAWVLGQKLSDINLMGFDGVLYGNVPIGASLSTSAAFELIIARAFLAMADFPWNPTKIAKLAQQAENEWVGMRCGIMDQMVIASAQENHALFIDCRDLSAKNVPLPKDVSIVVMDTATRRELANIGSYNERRQQCEEAARILNVLALRDVTEEIWNKSQNLLSDKHLLRARHVITENQRVLQAVQAMQQNDASRLGELMNASHESMRDDFEISTSKVDAMVNAARNSVGCFGARMTGGGFGGCAVALVKEMYADDFVYQVAEQYEYETKLKPSLYITKAVGGVDVSKI